MFFGLLLAALVHGLYDFFLTGQENGYQFLGLSLMLVIVHEFHRRFAKHLNHAPQFSASQQGKLRVSLLPWLSAPAVLILGLLYAYFYLALGTDLANRQIATSALASLPPALVALAALGRFDLQRGRTKAALPRIRKPGSFNASGSRAGQLPAPAAVAIPAYRFSLQYPLFFEAGDTTFFLCWR